MSKTNIKWGCIQPLTGGMYLGTEKAIGHPAEWIISYQGLTDLIYDKKEKDKVVCAANERYLVDYLKKKNRMPDYYVMNRTMMQFDTDYNPEYTLNGNPANPNISNMDLVVGVPVCAGLSMGAKSATSDELREERNCQMIWMANYALKTIRPKVYIFENAPTLMSGRGDSVRPQLEQIASEAGYSIVYYKTDTKYHHNAQRRPRTFVCFLQHRDGKPFIPNFNFEHDTVSTEQFFNELKVLPNDPMDVTLSVDYWFNYSLGYIRYKYGEDWREKIKGTNIFDFVLCHPENQPEFIKWMEDNFDNKEYYTTWVKHLNHCNEKFAEGKGIWRQTPFRFDDLLPACMYRNIMQALHYKEDRPYTMREWLWTMGHPNDFNMIGVPLGFFPQMGQNVPVNTAKWITSEAVRFIEKWDTEEDVSNGKNVAFYDNSKSKRIY